MQAVNSESAKLPYTSLAPALAQKADFSAPGIALLLPIILSAAVSFCVIYVSSSTIGWAPVYYTFNVSVLLFISLWIGVLGQVKWLAYVGIAALVLLHEAAIDGSLYIFLGVNKADAPYWIPITGQIHAAYGVFAAAYLIDTPHKLNVFRKPLIGLSILFLAAVPIVFIVDPHRFRQFVNVCIVIMIACNLIAPFSWSNNSATLRWVVSINFCWIVAVYVVYFIFFPDQELLDGKAAENLRRLVYALIVLSALVIFSVLVQSIDKQRTSAIANAMNAARAEAQTNRELLDTERRYRATQDLAAFRSKQLQTAAQDIRQPLRSLRGMIAGLSHDRTGALEENIAEAIDYLDAVAKDYLEPNTNNNDAELIEPELFECFVLLRTLENMFIEQARQQNIQLRFALCGAVAHAAPLPLLRILSNLISNSLEHSSCSSIVVGCRRHRAAISFEVHDNGRGYSPEFASVDRSKSAEENRGLGLGIVRDLCNRHGFSFSEKSNYEAGSVFRVEVVRANPVIPLP